METFIAKNRNLKNHYLKLLTAGKAKSNLHRLNFLLKNQFRGLTDVLKKKLDDSNLKFHPEHAASMFSSTPFLEFHVLPPFETSLIDTKKLGVSLNPLTESRYYQVTSFTDRQEGMIYLSVQTGKNFDTFFPAEASFELGFITDACGGFKHTLELPGPSNRAMIIRVSAEVQLPDCDIQDITELWPGNEADPFYGLCGVNGDFHLTVTGFKNSRLEWFTESNSKDFLGAYKAEGDALNHYYERSFTITTDLKVPPGIKDLEIWMNANIAAHTSQNYTPDLPEGPPIHLALLDLRNQRDPEHPVYADALGRERGSMGGIKVQGLKVQMFYVLGAGDDNGTH